MARDETPHPTDRIAKIGAVLEIPKPFPWCHGSEMTSDIQRPREVGGIHLAQ
ncbi:MAG: hypothetical protein ACKN9U_18765 [Pirellulaceae bacterium]